MDPAHACHRHVMISGKVYRTVADGSWSVPRRIEDMDGMRVGRQALSPMPELLSYWLPLDDARALIRYLNEHIAEMIAAAPGRFVALGAVPLQDTDAAIRELEYVTGSLGFRGVEIASHVNGASQVVLGSDYPFDMGDPDPIGTLERSGLDAATVAAITSGNGRRFLGIA